MKLNHRNSENCRSHDYLYTTPKNFRLYKAKGRGATMSNLIAEMGLLSFEDSRHPEKLQFPQLSDEEKALGCQFETLSSRFDEPESLIKLNDSLRNKTFITGNLPSPSDLVVFSNAFALASKWTSSEEISKFRHILRWIDLLQNTIVAVPETKKIKLDHDIAIPREVKEKKKPSQESQGGKEKEKNSKQKDSSSSDNDVNAKMEAQKAKKEAKAKAKVDNKANQQAESVPPNPSMIEFRVGHIQKAVKHPNADSLYMSTVDVGDAEGPRTVCSGLVKYISLEDMQNRHVVCVSNLKPVSMRGIKSCAMVLCASNESTVEFIKPPEGSKAGDKIFFETYDGVPEKQLNPKKKIWESVQPNFSTNENFEVIYKCEGLPKKLINEKGEVCKNSTIVSADVK